MSANVETISEEQAKAALYVLARLLDVTIEDWPYSWKYGHTIKIKAPLGFVFEDETSREYLTTCEDYYPLPWTTILHKLMRGLAPL